MLYTGTRSCGPYTPHNPWTESERTKYTKRNSQNLLLALQWLWKGGEGLVEEEGENVGDLQNYFSCFYSHGFNNSSKKSVISSNFVHYFNLQSTKLPERPPPPIFPHFPYASPPSPRTLHCDRSEPCNGWPRQFCGVSFIL